MSVAQSYRRAQSNRHARSYRHVLIVLAVAVITIVPLTQLGPTAGAATARTTVDTAAAKAVVKTTEQQATTKKKRRHLSTKVRRSNKPRHIAHRMVERKHDWSHRQYKCVRALWHRESGWQVKAGNPAGAYGIPQAYPGRKMGRGWRTSAKAQIRWGLQYIEDQYRTPCRADRHQRTIGWY